jgi:hypothetical protein
MNTEEADFDRMADLAEASQRRITVLLGGYMQISALMGKTPVGCDVSIIDLSEIIAETMKKFTSSP